MPDNPFLDSYIVPVTSHNLRTMPDRPALMSVMGAGVTVVARLTWDMTAVVTLIRAAMTDVVAAMWNKGATMTDMAAALSFMGAIMSFLVGTLCLSENGLSGVNGRI